MNWAIGILDEHTTPSGERVIERWLPKGVYQRSKGDFVDVNFSSLSWYNPETMRFWGIGREIEVWKGRGFQHWNVSYGDAEYQPESREDRGPWFTIKAEGYREIEFPAQQAVDRDTLVSKLPLQFGLIAAEMFARFKQLERRMPASTRLRGR